jgi:hypothetical protein
MGLFGGKREQGPAEAFAAEEQARADGLARRIGELAARPDEPMAAVLPHFRDAYRNACENAAAHTEQPHKRP